MKNFSCIEKHIIGEYHFRQERRTAGGVRLPVEIRTGIRYDFPVRTWTFISNHAAVLGLIDMYGSITAREMAARTGITERAVLRIVSELEAEGYIVKIREGRKLRYEVNRGLSMRHGTQKHRTVGEMLAFLGFEADPDDSGRRAS